MFVSTVNCFSSEYGESGSIVHTMNNIIGPPAVFPQYGDSYETASFKKFGKEVKLVSYTRNRNGFISQDFVELSFPQRTFLQKISLFETSSPGSLFRILVLNSHQHWVVVWVNSNFGEEVEEKARVFVPQLKQSAATVVTNTIRLEFNHTFEKYFYQLDAVQLHGININNIYNNNNLINHKNKNTKSTSCNNNTNNNKIKINMDFEGSSVDGFIFDKIIIKNNINININNNIHDNINNYDNKIDIKSDIEENGRIMVKCLNDYSGCNEDNVFLMLPYEILSTILSILDLKSLCRTATTCRLLKILIYNDTKQYNTLDLQPYWHLTTTHTLNSLQSRCTDLRTLNLAWCSRLNSLQTFLQSCGSSLLKLDVSCCSPFLNLSLSLLSQYCPSLEELKLCNLYQDSKNNKQHSKNLENLDNNNHDSQHNNSYKHIGSLKNLKHLDLLQCSISTNDVCSIVTKCDLLQVLLLGKCGDDFDVILHTFNTHHSTPKLRVFDASQNFISSHVLMEFVMKCHTLTHLDLSFCRGLRSETGVYEILVKKCLGLQNLNLTANRTVRDEDVVCISINCASIMHLDLTGIPQITNHCIHQLLLHNHKLIHLNISYCMGIEVNEFLDSHPSIKQRIDFICVGNIESHHV